MSVHIVEVEGAEYTEIVAQIIDENGNVLASQMFTPGTGSVLKSFTLSTHIQGTKFKMRYIVRKTKTKYKLIYSNTMSALYYANQAIISLYNLSFSVPSYKFTSTIPIKINRGYANFIATDGGTNAYDIN